MADADGVVAAVKARADHRRSPTVPNQTRRLACWKLSLSCVSATSSTNCAGCTPISWATSTMMASRITSSSRWLRLSLHIVIWRCEWCSACSFHHQPQLCWPRWIQ
jgi:hypothetical protein